MDQTSWRADCPCAKQPRSARPRSRAQYLAGYADFITLAILRWDTGFFLALLCDAAFACKMAAVERLAAGGHLGRMFFGLFFVLYHIAIG